MRKLSYRTAITSHGGIILKGREHNVKVSVGGSLKEASIDRDIHVCPLCCHGVNVVFASGFADFMGINHTLKGDVCACGAVVVGESDNTYSD